MGKFDDTFSKVIASWSTLQYQWQGNNSLRYFSNSEAFRITKEKWRHVSPVLHA